MGGTGGGGGQASAAGHRRAASAGAVRPSHLITMFGPGSLVQTRNDSVVVMGPESWAKPAGHYKVIHHAYLEALLGKTHFRMPSAGGGREQVVACRSFPTWGVCSNPKCKAMQRHRDAPPRGRSEFRCDLCKKPLYPARFIVMCERGHLDDFPWREWAHSRSKKKCDDPHPVLRMRARGKSTALSDYYVKCDACGASCPCGMAVSPGGLDGIVDRCCGMSPWLGGREEERAGAGGGDGACPAKPRGIQTLSTSLYYPSTVSALYIPKMLNEIQQFIAEHKDKIDSAREMGTDRKIAEQLSLFADLRERHGAGVIEAQLREWYEPTGAGGERLTRASSEMDIRRAEYDDLTAHAEFHYGDYLEIASPPLGGEAAGHLSSLRTVKRLTEIRVIRSFTRGVAPDPYSTEETSEVHYCRIAGGRMDWYPAVENRGEGMLFSLSEERLRRWEARADVAARCKATISAVGQWDAEHGWRRQDAARPRYLLIHTVSHMLAREMALRSGYSEASIRERLYCGDDYNGVLLYTASPSSDGSLGGLAKQGEPDAFWDALRSAVRRSRRCSSDPLCSDDDPALREQNGMPVVARLNGSACYACTLLPETSCENANRLLDRSLVAGESLGFFSGLE